MKKFDKKSLGVSSIGINMAVGIAVFTYLGYLIDQKRGGGQIFTLIGIFFGLGYCGYEVWKLIKKMDQDSSSCVSPDFDLDCERQLLYPNNLFRQSLGVSNPFRRFARVSIISASNLTVLVFCSVDIMC